METIVFDMFHETYNIFVTNINKEGNNIIGEQDENQKLDKTRPLLHFPKGIHLYNNNLYGEDISNCRILIVSFLTNVNINMLGKEKSSYNKDENIFVINDANSINGLKKKYLLLFFILHVADGIDITGGVITTIIAGK